MKTCEYCRYFSDFRDTEDEPVEVNGYCTADYVKDRLSANPYGGHWTYHDSTCDEFEAGAPIFAKGEPAKMPAKS